jgi:hypothetical protein
MAPGAEKIGELRAVDGGAKHGKSPQYGHGSHCAAVTVRYHINTI